MSQENTKKLPDWIYILFWAVLPLISVSTLIDHTLLPRQVFMGFVVLLLSLVSWKTLANGKFIPGGSVLSYTAFFAISIISGFGAINGVESMGAIGRYGLLLSFLVLSISLIRQGAVQRKSVISGVLIFAGIAAVYAAFQILAAVGDGNFLEDIYVVKGSFSHKNLLSSALMLSLPFVALGYSSFKGIWKQLSLILIFLIVAEIFTLRTRGVWLSTAIGGLVTLGTFIAVRKKPIKGLKFPAKLVGIGVGLATIILIGLFSVSGVKSSVTDQTNLNSRQKFWKASIKMVKEDPAFGVGAGNWKINFPKYGLFKLDDNVMQGVTHIQRPHDDYLWVLSEGGMLSLLGYLGVFVFAFVRIRNNLKSAENLDDIILNLSMVFGITAFMTFSVTDFPMERVSHSALILTMIALVYSTKREEKIAIKPGLVRIAVIVLAAVGVFISYQRSQGEKGAVKVLEYNAQRNAQMIIPAVEKAENDYFNMDNFANPLRYYSSLGHLAQKRPQKAFEDIQLAYDIHPYNILVIGQMANILNAQGKYDESLKFYKKAIKIAPRFEMALLGAAEIHLRKGEVNKAMLKLARIPISSKNPRYTRMLGTVLPQLGKAVGTSKKHTALIQYFNKNNASTPEQYVQLYFQYKKMRAQQPSKRKRKKVKKSEP